MDYIGRTATYGIFEKQNITPNGTDNEFTLIYQVGSASSMLVVYGGVVQEPLVDYAISEGGKKIVFAEVPQIGFPLYIVFLGRELQVPSVAGNFPVHHTAVGSGSQTQFTLPLSPLTPAALMVFKNGILQRYNAQWNVSTNIVEFVTAPEFGSHLDFYIHGVERTDLVTVDPLSITTEKLAAMAVTGDKLNLVYEPYETDPVIETFGGMEYSNVVIHEARWLDTGQIIKLRLHFSLSLTGGDNKIRVSLPVNNSGKLNVAGSVTLTTGNYIENGLLKWGDVGFIDIYRAFAVNYLEEDVTVEVNMEYESA